MNPKEEGGATLEEVVALLEQMPDGELANLPKESIQMMLEEKDPGKAAQAAEKLHWRRSNPMSETIYRVLHIFESDYGCEEHSEPMVDVVLESPDGRRSTIPYSDARLYALDIFEGDSVTLHQGQLKKVHFQGENA